MSLSGSSKGLKALKRQPKVLFAIFLPTSAQFQHGTHQKIPSRKLFFRQCWLLEGSNTFQSWSPNLLTYGFHLGRSGCA